MSVSLRNIAIRVDASSQIGTGHFMRCLTLADVLKHRGATIRFICRHISEYLQAIAEDRGYEIMLFKSPEENSVVDELLHSCWLGTNQQVDAEESIKLLSDQTWDWLIVDHYALDWRWESSLRSSTKHLLVIDDLADRKHDCDILLDQNFYADMQSRYFGKVPEHCRLLLGPRYALLRDEFRQLREQVKLRTVPVKRILVFFGGVDVDNYTGKTIEALVSLGMKDLHVDIVVGKHHPYREQIESICLQQNFGCHIQTNRMAELMAAADLSIGAGGSATWERCCLGLPTIAFCTADNQFKQIIDAAAEGLIYAPDNKNEFTNVFKRHLLALMENNCLLRSISEKAIQAVDGCGALRLISKMGFSGIYIRVASAEDSEYLFAWRNHPSIRLVSRNTEEISWHNHQQWFSKVLNSSDKLLLLGEREGKSVGVIRFDIEGGDEAEVSIYLVPSLKESGLGGELLQSAEHWLADHYSAIRFIRAQVLGNNIRSHRLFSGADYKLESTFYIKELRCHE
ncbi:MAG: UDP-2,4-diacetamido-2,4,6-trideoxy-beta-L-altropyranose hydrolase [Chlorobium sp.]|nr:UDP-2,4-diacetamido-2,4,6-trideoxy-beta-L-altropyranose hydrolase [Chlorobium sp.]